MAFEEWQFQNKLISERLDYISKRTHDMAWVGSAHPDNSEFNELMLAQHQLIDAADRLIKKYLSQRSG